MAHCDAWQVFNILLLSLSLVLVTNYIHISVSFQSGSGNLCCLLTYMIHIETHSRQKSVWLDMWWVEWLWGLREHTVYMF